MQVTFFSHFFTDTSQVPMLRKIRSEVQRQRFFLQGEANFTFGSKWPLQLRKIEFLAFLLLKINKPVQLR